MKFAYAFTIVTLVCFMSSGCAPENTPAPPIPVEKAPVAQATPPPVEQTAPPKVTQLPPGAMPDDGPINLLTSTGDEAEDEARLAQAKLMGLGHQPVAGEEQTAPTPIEPVARVEKVEPVDGEPNEPPSNDIPNYFKGLDEIGLTLSVGKDKKNFAETALQAATQGDTTLIKDLRDRYKKAAVTAGAMQVPQKAMSHHRLTVESFEKGADMMDFILETLESGDLSGIGGLGSQVAEIKSLGEKADAQAAALGHTD